MLWWIYELVFWAALLLASPYYLLRMKRRGGYARGFGERFGIFDREKIARLQGTRPIWIHAVSVGEVDLALQLIAKFLQSPNPPRFALSTTTSTGHALAARKLPPEVSLFYYPLDSRFCFQKVHRLLSPKALILMEAELWPNHLRFCGERKLPVMLINARLSKRFYPRYRKFRWLFKKSFEAFRCVTLQSEDDLERLFHLGFRKEALTLIGNLKYDTAMGDDTERRSRLATDLAPFRGCRFWIAGSTHPGEEKIVLEIFMRLQKKFPDLLLGLAPRHAERAGEISDLMKGLGVPHLLRSQLNGISAPSISGIQVLLLNTTGELKYLYEHAALIFIGKSLLAHGGQNLIEPAACGKPVIFGPHMENFESIAKDFLSNNAAVQVSDPKELENKVEYFLQKPLECSILGEKAFKVFQSKRGGMERTVMAIQKALST